MSPNVPRMIQSFLEQIPKGLWKEILDIRCYTEFRGAEWSMTAEVSAARYSGMERSGIPE